MNMKKTIAVLAASSLAVSAMATTVSAFDAQTLHYNLVEIDTTRVITPGYVTLTYRFNSVPATATADTITLKDTGSTFDYTWGADIKIQIKGTLESGKTFTETYVYSDNKDAENNSKYISHNWYNALVFELGKATTLKEGSELTVAATMTHKVTEIKYVNNAIAAGEITANYNAAALSVADSAAALAALKAEINAEYDALDAAAAAAALTADNNLAIAEATMKTDALYITNKAISTEGVGDALKNNYTQDDVDAADAVLANLGIKYLASADAAKATADAKVTALVTERATKLAAAAVTAATGETGALPLASNFSKPVKDSLKPFKTQLKSATDVIDYLATAQDLKGKDNGSYKGVKAVLNDAVVNYDSTTFTFTTATGYVCNDASQDNYGVYCESWSAGAVDYSTFGQYHYGSYDGYGYLTTGYFYDNLFSGALVINEALTMSLSDVNKFTYGEGTISFTWENITEKSTAKMNSYATYLATMRLYTSNDWYWSALDVVLANTEDENVDLGAGEVAEEEEIVDEETDEEIEVEVETEVETETEVEAEVETVAETAPVANVNTGNASVALAVIPVALAAAAIVAKKRG